MTGYSYWYFTYEINNKKTGAHAKDDGIIMSIDGFFPIGTVMDMCSETFGDGYSLTVLNTVEISEDSYNSFYAETSKFPEEGGGTNDMC